jgi:uncharacterized protein (TIGR03435 family)
MPESDDISLLRQYTESDSESAFAALVERHINKVYSVALRHTRNSHQAEEITQAVFVILAKKAGGLGKRVILSGWLYQTARLASVTLLRSEIRRARREQEAHMQNILDQPVSDEAWQQIAPRLDEAMASLNETDRHAVVLRFFDGKSMNDVGVALGASEEAAKKRVNRALEKLQKFFTKRGVVSTTAIIAGAISSNSVQAAPAALAKSVTAIALAKGATTSISTLILVKGALKIMAWTKMQTAIVASAVVLIVAAGTTTVTVKEVQRHEDSQWDIGQVDGMILRKAPHIVRIIPSKFPNSGGWVGNGNGSTFGLNEPVAGIISDAYGQDSGTRTILPAELPQTKYDFIANLLSGSREALQQQIKKQFGIIAQWETIETNVLFLRVATPNVSGLHPSAVTGNASTFNEYGGLLDVVNQPVSSLIGSLEFSYGVPVIDQTALMGRFDIHLKWDFPDDEQHAHLTQALNSQLGLELVPGTAPVKMLVVKKAN